eukprot:9025525-Alexandrium_andersonii.AAC.1
MVLRWGRRLAKARCPEYLCGSLATAGQTAEGGAIARQWLKKHPQALLKGQLADLHAFRCT